MKSGAIRVFLKEGRELLRDKRVRSSAIMGPFLIIMLLMSTLGTLMEKVGAKSAMKIHYIPIQVDGKPIPATSMQIFKDMEDKGVTPVAVPDEAAATKQINDGKATMVLVFPNDYQERTAAGQPVEIRAIFDKNEERSQIAMGKLMEAMAKENAVHLAGLLESNGISSSEIQQVKLTESPISRKKTSGILLAMLPYLIVFWAFAGGMSAAADLIAGEKERNTLETLLITPISRTQIVWGKFLSLATVCLSSSLSGLIGVFVAAQSHLPGTKTMFPDGAGISVQSVAAIVLVLLPTVALFAGVLIAISTYAKNSREAQTYLSLTSLLVMMPALFSQFIGYTEYASAKWVSLVPVLNASVAVRNALLGKLDAQSLIITAATSAVIAAVSIAIAVRLFNREQVLLRT